MRFLPNNAKEKGRKLQPQQRTYLQIVNALSIWITRVFVSLVVILTFAVNSEAQDMGSEFVELGCEYRPRTEFRYGYRQLRADTSNPSLGTAQRLRFTTRYVRSKSRVVFSIQDVRVWGEEYTRSARGWLQAFEAYAEFDLSDRVRLKVGRQQLVFGDQRIFAANNWRHQGGKHDLIRLTGSFANVSYSVFGGYNRTQLSNLESDYFPDFPFYKCLLGGFVQRKLRDNTLIEILGFFDSYQNLDSGTEYGKVTMGARFHSEIRNSAFYGSFYFQGGKVVTGKEHMAWLGDVNLRRKVAEKYSLSFGVQMFSGDQNPEDGVSNAFLAQYGAFHRFNGKMDYTSRKVWLEEHPGIINPNIRQEYKLSERLALLLESHLLGIMVDPAELYQRDTDDWFWGMFYAVENDLTLRMIVSDNFSVHVAYMVLNSFEGIENLPSGAEGDHSLISHFSFVQLTWKPEPMKIFKMS